MARVYLDVAEENVLSVSDLIDMGPMVDIDLEAPMFSAAGFQNGEVSEFNLADYRGKWVLLFFYPADFTFVCPTELTDLADQYDKFKELGVEVMGMSTDTEWAHKVWHETSPKVGKVQYPLLADPNGIVSRAYGVYIEDAGVANRGAFIIDPDGMIKSISITAEAVGRNVQEVVRQVEALQHIRKNPDQACPFSFSESGETLKPGVDLAGKL